MRREKNNYINKSVETQKILVMKIHATKTLMLQNVNEDIVKVIHSYGLIQVTL